MSNKNLTYISIFLIHPFVILFFFPHIVFNCPGPDDLMALGASLNFDFLHNIIQYDRRLDRLPALLFTYVFYKVFPPMVAHYLLYFICFYLTTYLVFRIMKLIVSEEGAVLSAILLGTNFWLLPSFGSIWITRQIWIFLFLAFFFVLLSSQNNWRPLFSALTGFFWGCTFFSHFATLPFLYQIPLFFLVSSIIRKNFSPKTLFNFIFYFLLGFCVCFILFGLITRLFFNGNFLFFLNQLNTSKSDFSNYLRGFNTVYGTASNSLILFALAASIFSLFRKDSSDKTRIIVSVWFITSFLLYALFYYVGTFFPQTPIFSFVLWLYYYCRWIIPFCSIAIFAALIPKNMSWKPWHLLLFYMLSILSISSYGLKIVPFLNFNGFIAANTTHTALVGVLIAFLAAFRFTKANGAVAITFALFSNMILFNGSSEATARGYLDREYFSRLYNGNAFLQKMDMKTSYYSWLGKNRLEYGCWYEYKSFCKLWLLESNYVDDFPVFGTDKENRFDYDVFKVDNHILIVDEDADGKSLDRANAALANQDRKLMEIKKIHMEDGEYQYSMIFTRVGTDLRNNKKRLADLALIKDALEKFYVEKKSYPVSKGWDGIFSPWGYGGEDWIPALSPRYLKQLPRDPRNDQDPRHQYLYKSDGKNYKLIAHEPEDYLQVKEEKTANIDTTREALHSYAYGYWTEGAADWK